MAQLTLSHTLVPNTPENINDVQDNFDDITAHLNTALVGADNLTSPNYSVARVVRSRRFVRHGRNGGINSAHGHGRRHLSGWLRDRASGTNLASG